MANIQWDYAAIVTLMTNQLDGLANNVAALSVEYDNRVTGYTRAIFELNFTYAVSPLAGRTLDLYLIAAPNGTDYDDNWDNPEASKGGIPVQVSTSAQKVAIGLGRSEIIIPGLKFKIRVKNLGNQSLSASGHTLNMVPGRLKTV